MVSQAELKPGATTKKIKTISKNSMSTGVNSPTCSFAGIIELTPVIVAQHMIVVQPKGHPHIHKDIVVSPDVFVWSCSLVVVLSLWDFKGFKGFLMNEVPLF
ncbi:hypothetical protein Y032_0007g3512 [Ancylostoma ceylanicum]|uniref:Uncharacterized protein n=1 Tax=Ancylostoma ceylanicum TaxID=53326 RepID=A0A016VQ93_9BILA|nr:hypothetical protein Y032_0007g3512 [Ancylostoma ceylanicum]